MGQPAMPLQRHNPMEDAAAAYRRHMEEASTDRMLRHAAESIRPQRRGSEAVPPLCGAPQEPAIVLGSDRETLRRQLAEAPRRWTVAAPGRALPSLDRGGAADADRRECSVCFNGFEDEVCLPCDHSFCEPCIRTALVKNAMCPLCRRDMRAFAAVRGWDCATPSAPERLTFGLRRPAAPTHSDGPVVVRAGALVRTVDGSGSGGELAVFFARVDSRCRYGDCLLRKVIFQYTATDGAKEEELTLASPPFELPLAKPPPGAPPLRVVASIHPRPGLGVDRTPQFVPLSSDTLSGVVVTLRSTSQTTTVRRARVSDPGSMQETLTQLDTLRQTVSETHSQLAGTVGRIRSQASDLRAQLRESRRTPSLAEIVALNRAALGLSPAGTPAS